MPTLRSGRRVTTAPTSAWLPFAAGPAQWPTKPSWVKLFCREVFLESVIGREDFLVPRKKTHLAELDPVGPQLFLAAFEPCACAGPRGQQTAAVRAPARRLRRSQTCSVEIVAVPVAASVSSKPHTGFPAAGVAS